MAEERKGDVSAHISPKIAEVLKQRRKKNYETGVAAGLDPSITSEPSIGSLIRSCLLAALGIYKDYRGE